MSDPVRHTQRFTKRNPCPLCGGGDDDLRGKDRRCYGFLSADGQYIHCTRMTGAPYYEESKTYAHRRSGKCRCGVEHAPEPYSMPSPRKEALTSVQRTQEAEYLYRAANGAPVYKVTRYRLADGSKSYSISHPEQGRWVPGLGGADRLLYRLPDVLNAPSTAPVYVVEGEKCADALYALGAVATTNVNGAGKWRLTVNAADALRGRDVVILPDNDEVGERHARQIASDTLPVAHSVKVVALPDLPAKGDIVDWLASGKTRADLDALVAATAPWQPEDSAAADAPDANAGDPSEDDQEPPLVFLTREALRNLPQVNFLIYGVLKQVGISCIYAEPNMGKTYLALDWALHVATGRSWANKATLAGPVAYLAGEGVEDFDSRITAWEQIHQTPVRDFYVIGDTVPLLQASAVNKLIAAIDALPTPPVLIIIDTLALAMEGGDENNTPDMGKLVGVAKLLRNRYRCQVTFVHHKDKEGFKERGNSALRGAADTMVEMSLDGELVTLICSKQRGAPKFAPMFLTLQKLAADWNISGTECVIRPLDKMPDHYLRGSERRVLQVLLDTFGYEGVTSTDLKEVLVPVDMATRTYHLAIQELKKRGFLETQSKKLVISKLGFTTLEKSATSAIALQNTSLHSEASPPPIYGGGGEPLVGWSAAARKKPTPQGPCSRCKQVNWIEQPADFGGKVVCATCMPPGTWKLIS